MSGAIRVMLVCDQLGSAGGVERFVCELANSLVSEGMEVTVTSPDAPRQPLLYRLDGSVRVLTGRRAGPGDLASAADDGEGEGDGDGEGRIGRAWRILRAQWRLGRALSRLIGSDRPDVVVLNGLTTACSVLALDRRFARQTICCDHNHFGARSAIWRVLRRWLYPKVGALVSLTQADAQRFRALNPHTQVIYNASSLRAESPSAPSEGALVLAVGRHVAQKGFDLLVRAWAGVVRAVPRARLRVVGEGPLRTQHELMAQALGVAATIEWLGPSQEVERHFRDASVFVLPSRYEGMPLALLEAQALGVPAVAFDCPTGPGEIVTAQTGRLVAPGDVDGLRRALVELLMSPALCLDMARAAIERSREVFSPTQHADRWAALVREVAMATRAGARP